MLMMFRAGRAILASLLLAAILAGCRERGAASRPPADGYYRLPLTDNPVTLDPALFTDVNSEGVARRIFNNLVKLDSKLQPVPDLAESWKISEDGLTYTFTLRKGVRFHNGREMVADDVRFSFERLLRAETASQRAWVVEPIAGARELRDGKASSLAGLETPDAYTVTLRLKEAFSPALMLQLLAMGNAAIVPRECFGAERGGEKFGRRPVGTGPFRFVSWRDHDAVVLARNDQYFDGPAKLAGLRFRVIQESLVAWQEYLAGGLEHCAVPEGFLKEAQAGPLKGELRSTATLSTQYLGIAMSHRPWGSNVHLRRALNYAVDRKFLCERILGGESAPAKGVLPPETPGPFDVAQGRPEGTRMGGCDPALPGYSYDPERARSELREAGYGPGLEPIARLPEMTLYFNSRPPGEQVAEAVQADFRRIGLRVQLRALDLAALLEATNQEEPDLFRLIWAADFPDAESFLRVFYSGLAGSAGNRARYSNARVDDLLDRSRRELQPEKRLGLLHEAEKMIIADAPWVFLSHGRTHLLVKPYVRGLELTPMDLGTSVNQVDFHAVSFE
jgi:peptide/nickel transport system substrate-binding protein/oligopeptide transport system substrate-binding protein